MWRKAGLRKLSAAVVITHREGRDEGLLMVVKHPRVDTMSHCSCMTDSSVLGQQRKRLIGSGADMSCGLGKHQHHHKHNFSS